MYQLPGFEKPQSEKENMIVTVGPGGSLELDVVDIGFGMASEDTQRSVLLVWYSAYGTSKELMLTHDNASQYLIRQRENNGHNKLVLYITYSELVNLLGVGDHEMHILFPKDKTLKAPSPHCFVRITG